jgi:gluconolactonase
MKAEDIILYDSTQANEYADIQIQKLASGFQFTEGPVWHPDQFLLFSDTPANKIYQLFPDGNTKLFFDKSGLNSDNFSGLSDMIGSNGLAVADDGSVLVCQHGNHAIARLDAGKKLTTIVSEFEGRPLNSPNDLVIHSDGTIYFTDPPYGLKDQVLQPARFQNFSGIYEYREGRLSLLSTDLRYPNGICFSPGENYLYVSSNHPDEPLLWKFHLSATGIQDQSVLIKQNADGITTDKKENLLLCTDQGILVASWQGKRLALIPLPDNPTNLAWGGADGNDLYITARSNIYLVRGYKND